MGRPRVSAPPTPTPERARARSTAGAHAPRPQRGARRLPRNVVALAVVSFFTDVSSEMIYPLLPVFLSSVLGGSASFIGAIEGAAESTAALLKLASGWWSDRVTRRKPLVVAGYALASAARPLIAAATSPAQVLLIRLTDRVGKGIRSSPRDALIADSVDPAIRGRAFGFHRSADHAGAVVGPLVAFAVLQWGGVPLRPVFWLAAIPGLIAVLVLVTAVRETPGRGERGASATGAAERAGGAPADDAPAVMAEWEGGAAGLPASGVARGAPPENHVSSDPSTAHHRAAAARTETAPPLSRRFWAFLGVVLLFTLGNSTDAFLILRATQLGVSVALVPILWAMLHVVKSASSAPGGALSDRIGRKPLIVAGWLLYAVVYFAFGRADAAWQVWVLFAVYGVFFGLTEGTEKALVADLVPAARRGTAFGWYNLAIGLGALPASILFGAIWDLRGAGAAFAFGAALALAACVGMALVAPGRRPPRAAS